MMRVIAWVSDFSSLASQKLSAPQRRGVQSEAIPRRLSTACPPALFLPLSPFLQAGSLF
jgi:hypothetical protein